MKTPHTLVLSADEHLELMSTIKIPSSKAAVEREVIKCMTGQRVIVHRDAIRIRLTYFDTKLYVIVGKEECDTYMKVLKETKSTHKALYSCFQYLRTQYLERFEESVRGEGFANGIAVAQKSLRFALGING